MKIFIINLERASDRREKMIRQLKEAGLEGTFFKAVDGKALTQEQKGKVNQQKRRAFVNCPLSDNEIACALSHLAVMQAFLQTDEKMCVILEDDAALRPEFKATLQETEKLAPESFDFILLHSWYRDRYPDSFVYCKPLGADNALGIIRYSETGAVSYAVSRRGAERFLAYTQEFIHAVDKEICSWWRNGLAVFSLQKACVTGNKTCFSYINETRLSANLYPDAGRIVWRFKRKKNRIRESLQKRLAFGAYLRRMRQ